MTRLPTAMETSALGNPVLESTRRKTTVSRYPIATKYAACWTSMPWRMRKTSEKEPAKNHASDRTVSYVINRASLLSTASDRRSGY